MRNLTFKNLRSVVAVENRVKHDFRIVAVRVKFGAKAVSVWNDPGVFPNNGVWSRFSDLDSSLSCPSSFLKILLLAKRLVVVL